jgi:hypothetical protein
MRKPLFMEAARFRALFDPEYLGLSLLPDEDSGVEGWSYREDLEMIGAKNREREEFDEIRRLRAEALGDFGAMVDAEGGPEAFVARLRDGQDAHPWREAYRAAAIAWSIDYRSVRTLGHLRKLAAEHIKAVTGRDKSIPGTGLPRRLLWPFLPSRNLRVAFAEFTRRFAPDLPPRDRKLLWRALRADFGELRTLVRIAVGLDPGAEPEAESAAILRMVAHHPDTWSQQLVTLRTVQALSVLDIRNYRRQVFSLGGFGCQTAPPGCEDPTAQSTC